MYLLIFGLFEYFWVGVGDFGVCFFKFGIIGGRIARGGVGAFATGGERRFEGGNVGLGVLGHRVELTLQPTQRILAEEIARVLVC